MLLFVIQVSEPFEQVNHFAFMPFEIFMTAETVITGAINVKRSGNARLVKGLVINNTVFYRHNAVVVGNENNCRRLPGLNLFFETEIVFHFSRRIGLPDSSVRSR